MKVGLIGFGGMGRHHASQIAANPEMELIAVADPSEKAREDARSRYGVPTYESGDAMIERSGAEGIVVVSPTRYHLPHIVKAAREGMHVFSEKPLCLPLGDTSPLRAVLEETGVTFGFGLVLRYMAPYREAKRRIDAGDLGRAVLGCARYGGIMDGYDYVYSPELGGGLANENAIHMIDMIDHLLGPAKRVAVAMSSEGRRTEDNAAILFWGDGSRETVLAASGMTRLPSRIEITGTEAELTVTGNQRLHWTDAKGSGEVSLKEEGDPYGLELEEWRRAIAENRAPLTGLSEALRISALMKAIYRAGASGQIESVPDA